MVYILVYIISYIESKVGGEGRWSDQKKVCPHANFLKGAQYKSEPEQGGMDDTAGNSLNMLCEDATILEGDGLDYGSWSKMVSCPPKSLICGIMNKVEDHMGAHRDDTAHNQVKFYCCAF